MARWVHAETDNHDEPLVVVLRGPDDRVQAEIRVAAGHRLVAGPTGVHCEPILDGSGGEGRA